MGRDGIGNFRSILYNMRQSQFISEHDRYLGEKIAWVLSGGDVDLGTEVDEWYLLDLERKAFLEVCRTPKTLERIQAHAQHRQTPSQLTGSDRTRLDENTKEIVR